MGLFDKVKNFLNATEEEYVQELDDGDYDPSGPAPSFRDEFQFGTPASAPVTEREGSKIVDLHSSSRAHVVFKKLDRFQDVGTVADVLNEKRIVILNLETCPADNAQRIIDFLYGVAYANSGEIKRVAGRAYIITPYNVPITGELLDEFAGSGFGGVFE